MIRFLELHVNRPYQVTVINIIDVLIPLTCLTMRYGLQTSFKDTDHISLFNIDISGIWTDTHAPTHTHTHTHIDLAYTQVYH